MLQDVKTLIALLEALGSVPGTHTVTYNCPLSQFQEMELPHLTSKGTRYTYVTHTYMQAKHSHT